MVPSISVNVARRFDGSRPMSCAICGRKAHYYHFNVASCEGCGFFFKRCIYKNKNYLCSRVGNCMKVKVLECRACRFDKCILAGMNLEMMKFPVDFNLDEAKRRIQARKGVLLKGEKIDENFQQNDIKNVLILDEWAKYEQILVALDYIEKRHRRIRESSTIIPNNFIKSKCLADFLITNENIIAKAQDFSEMPIGRVDPRFLEEILEGKKFLDGHPPYLHLDLFFCVEMAKTMPVFWELDLDDKISLLSHVSMVSMILYTGFYSLEKQNSTIVYPDGMMPILIGKKQFDTGIDLLSSSVDRLRMRIFCDSLKIFERIGLTQQEMLLLRAIIFSHITTPNLSPAAQRLLLNEAEKYSKILLKYCQRRLGDSEGARRYADVVLFLEFLFRNAQQHREFITTMEAHFQMTKNGLFPAIPPMPKFVTECINGCRELPEIQAIQI